MCPMTMKTEKTHKRKFLETILRWMACAVLKKYNPIVVGITGSVGKTSAKEATFLVLSHFYRVRQSEKNYNNEIGIPLTIIGARSGEGSLARWVRVVAHWLWVLLFPVEYPEVLVVEMGIDRPGDMAYLLSFVPVHAAVVTTIGPAHVEFFGSIERIAAEKERVVSAVGPNGNVILNADDPRVAAMAKKAKAPVTTFGCVEASQVFASDITQSFSQDNALKGIRFKLNYEGKSIPVRLPNVIARHYIPAVLAALSVGIALRLNLVACARAVENFIPLPGRMNLLTGVHGSMVIDDTYNASPRAVEAALQTLAEMPATRRIAVLGDMLELGPVSDGEHAALAARCSAHNITLLYAVGERMEHAYRTALSSGLFTSDRVFYFEDPVLTGRAVAQILRAGDVVLVKGSQGMRMEKVVEQIMAESHKAQELLCRQSPEWKAKPFVKP